MQPSSQQDSPAQKQPPKKKVKNKGWGNEPLPFEYVPQKPASKKGKYKNITEMGQTYAVDMNAVLGSGFASTVYLGVRIADNSKVCIKAVDFLAFGSINSPYIALIHQEIECLKQFSCQYIVQLYDVYQSPTFCYLVMELCEGGDLFKMMRLAPFPLPCEFVGTIMSQVVGGLSKIHGKNMIHRDLKTENIFVSSFPKSPQERIRVKIGDLGFCVTAEELSSLQGAKSPLNVGSPIYMSPETQQIQQYSKASDIYAIGIIWYQLLHKVAPWEAKTEAELLEKKLNSPVADWREDIPQNIRQTISKCLDNDPTKRPTCAELQQLLVQPPLLNEQSP